jgi:hypothetical protein
MRRIATMHAFSEASANAEDREGDLPAPEQWLLTRANEMHLAETIERHIDFVDRDDRSVHLAMPFVGHYLQRHDNALPTVAAIATQPIILADGTVLAQTEGLDRGRGIVFHIASELLDLVPGREGCTPEAVVDAMRRRCRLSRCAGRRFGIRGGYCPTGYMPRRRGNRPAAPCAAPPRL